MTELTESERKFSILRESEGWSYGEIAQVIVNRRAEQEYRQVRLEVSYLLQKERREKLW